jgi:hypothetical protein
MKQEAIWDMYAWFSVPCCFEMGLFFFFFECQIVGSV